MQWPKQEPEPKTRTEQQRIVFLFFPKEIGEKQVWLEKALKKRHFIWTNTGGSWSLWDYHTLPKKEKF